MKSKSATPSRWRRGAGGLTALAMTAGLVAALAGPASGAEGSAPAPLERAVIAGVHTDLVSTFVENDQLVLDSMADTPETGTRYSEDEVWFHLDDTALTTVSTATEFVAPAGTQVWLASQSYQPDVLWAGFSTESVPAGSFDGDTTFTLSQVRGPGDVEVWLTGADAPVEERLWSSDEGISSFSRPSSGVHLHANWAFTAPGIYELDVQASAPKAGQTLTATGTYTFVVGDLPEDVNTATTLAASAEQVVPGAEVTLTASVQPAVEGFVEFLDGDMVLGHEAVEAGTATFTTSALGLGARAVTARYVPAVENLSNTSTSAPVTVTVVEEGQEVFGVHSASGSLSFQAGDTIDLYVGGYELQEGEDIGWVFIDPVYDYELMLSGDYWLPENRHYLRDATAAFDGTSVSAAVLDANGRTVHRTPFVTIAVTGENVGTGVLLRMNADASSYFADDAVHLTVEAPELADGQTLAVVSRPVPYQTAYDTPWSAVPTPTETGFVVAAELLRGSEAALELRDADGVVLGRSAPITADVTARQVQLTGVGAAYRLGDTAQITAEVAPGSDDLTFDWGYYNEVFDDQGHLISFEWVQLAVGSSPTVELAVTQELADAGSLHVQIERTSTGYWVASTSATIYLTDAAPGEQDVILERLSGHYHQGYTINLRANAFPAAAASDTYRWLLKLPTSEEFLPLEGKTGAAESIIAEQALNGAVVKVEMRGAAGNVLATSDEAVIHHDDHGGAPRQKVTVAAPQGAVQAGDPVELSASVAPISLLTRYQWSVQLPGETTPSVMPDAQSSTLSIPTVPAAWNGASITAALVYPDGSASPYPASPPVTLTVEGAEPEPVSVSVAGLSDHYHAGGVLALNAVVDGAPEGTHLHWFTKDPGSAEWVEIDGAGETVGAIVRTADNGREYKVQVVGEGEVVLAESDPVTVVVDDHGASPVEGAVITATLPENAGALVISVAPENSSVDLGEFALNPAADRYVASGELGAVTVTDTRTEDAGWAASARVRGFVTADGERLAGGNLGWAPKVLSASDGQVVTPGAAKPSVLSGGAGVAAWSPLGSAAAGEGRGTAQLGADLVLEAPTTIGAGTYQGLMILTVV